MLTTFLVDTIADDPLATAAETDTFISLREAVQAANTNAPFGDAAAGAGRGTVDTIVFDPSLAGQTIALSGVELLISDDLSLTGLGQNDLAISGNAASRVFRIDVGVSVEISDLTISGGSAYEGGGIYNEGTLTVRNTFLTDNSGDDYGGAIANSSGGVTLTNTTLSANSSYYQGGAIWSDGTLEITSSTFFENYSDYEGGGIWNGGTLDIADNTFLDNSAALHGGGIYTRDGSVTIAGSEFSGNEAYSTGGAFSSFVHLSGTDKTLDVTGSTFTGNEAGSGGAIWCDMPASISDSTISGNSARSFGGGISHRIFTVTITNSTLANNSSGAYGGAIDSWGNTVILRNSTISGNSADWDGGAIENYFATVKLFNSTISGNSAGGLGGAIDNWVGTLESTNSTIVMNRADADGDGSGTGGAIYNYNTSSVALLNNTVLAGNLLGADGSDSPNDLAGVDVEPASSHNLIGDASSSGGLVDDDQGNIVGNGGSGTIDITTVLDPNLADNGGPTLTHALVSGSPALDAGDNSKAVDGDGATLVYDQRGVNEEGPGFDRIVDGVVDIGAFEVQPPILTVQIDVKPGSDTNPINLAGNGVIAVSIITTEDFNAADVNVSTVVWAGANVAQKNNGSFMSALEDVDGDGDLDLVLHFQLAETNLLDIYEDLLRDDLADGTLDSYRQSVDIALKGFTNDGDAFRGTDTLELFLTGKNLDDFRNQRDI